MTAGPAKENNCALEFLNGHQMLGRRELKRKFRRTGRPRRCAAFGRGRSRRYRTQELPCLHPRVDHKRSERAASAQSVRRWVGAIGIWVDTHKPDFSTQHQWAKLHETDLHSVASPLSDGELNIGCRSRVQPRNDPHSVCKFQHQGRGGIYDRNYRCTR